MALWLEICWSEGEARVVHTSSGMKNTHPLWPAMCRLNGESTVLVEKNQPCGESVHNRVRRRPDIFKRRLTRMWIACEHAVWRQLWFKWPIPQTANGFNKIISEMPSILWVLEKKSEYAFQFFCFIKISQSHSVWQEITWETCVYHSGKTNGVNQRTPCLLSETTRVI